MQLFDALPWMNLAAYVFMIIMNILSSMAVFNGQGNGDVSRKYDTQFTPDGWAFSIWSVIFIALAFFIRYQFSSYEVVERIGFLFIVNMIGNGLWSVFFAYELITVTVITMAVILFSLIFLYEGVSAEMDIKRQLQAEQAENDFGEADLTTASPTYSRLSVYDYWCGQFPLSIYLGWISVATIANVSIFLGTFSVFRGEGEGAASCIMQVVASLLAFAMLVRKQDQVFAFVIVWALFAISSKQGGSVSECAFVLAVIVLLATLASFAFPKQLRAMGKRLEGRTSSVAI